ncbi:MAG TPA: hypothetical protein DDX92_13885 [Flavobacteriales bacterium]|jgi:CHASE2 domain-containing sensor protein|nr:hypothetical protein [Flavobacteriales bacterium]
MRLFNYRSNLFCTGFILIVVYLLVKLPAQFELLDPIGKALTDFELSDMVFSQLRDKPPPDTNIVLVNIGTLDRSGIAEQIKVLNKFNPKILGIDVFFRERRDFRSDMELMLALSEVDNLVLVSDLLIPDSISNCFQGMSTSNFIFTSNASLGYAEMKTTSEGYKTVRQFVPFTCVNDSSTQAFSVVIADKFDSTSVDLLQQRNNEREVINWKGNYRHFYQLDVQDVLRPGADLSFVKDKIVLMGFMGQHHLGEESLEDTFFTPMNPIPAGRSYPDMYGVTLHANIISMILSKEYIFQFPLWGDILITIILLYLNVALFIYIAERKKVYYDLITKSLILVEIIVLFSLTILLLLYFHVKLDFTFAILTILLSGDLTELYVGSLRELAGNAIKRVRARFNF